MSTSLPGQPIGKEESGFYEPYAALARNLRTWFIAYGIGGPVIFLTNEPAAKALYSAGVGRSVAYCFLGGVVLQIVTVMLYKSAMWYLYMGELETVSKSTCIYNAAEWLSERYWPEALSDVVTLGLFAWATLKALHLIAP